MENGESGPGRVTTLELFFDLVFVFTITQITKLVERARRARMALMAFGYGYLVMLAGVIVLAAGLEGVLANLGETTETLVTINQGVGVALYLMGETAFRRLVAIPPGRLRPLAALAAVATIPIGMSVSGLTQMWLLLAIVAGTLVVEGRRVEWQHTT